MRRRRESESSLELLLDTMCNTFGGVMFIAITLAVIIAGRQISPKHEEKSRITDVRQLQSEIQALEIALQKTQAENAALAKEEALISQDSRMQLVGEIALLEKKLQNIELSRELEVQKTTSVDAEKVSLEIELQQLQKKLLALTKKLEEANRNLADERSKIEELKQKIRLASTKTLTFHVLTEKTKMPYYIFLRDDRAWRVGPLRTGNQWSAEPDVAMTQSGNQLSFAIHSDQGRNVCANDTFTDGFNQLLSAVPADRIIVFVVEPSAAKTFCKIRETLKKQNFFHGFVMYEKLESFNLLLADEVHYEY